MGNIRRSTAGGYVWRRHLRGIWPWLILLTLLLCAYVVFTFWYLIPQRADASTTALVAVSLFALMYLIYRKVEAVDSRWGKGARAEQMVGRELDKLHREGFHVFHDYYSGRRGNVDHFIVGASGVFAIETKSCTGEITSDGEELFRDGKRLRSTDPISQVKGEAAEIHELIEDTCGIDRWVQPILCYSDADVRFHSRVRGVDVVKCGALSRVIMKSARGEVLSESEIRAISKMLQRKIGAAPSASPGSPPPTQGWLRNNVSPDRIFVAGFLVFLLIVSILFAETTAMIFNDLSNLYGTLGLLKSYYL